MIPRQLKSLYFSMMALPMMVSASAYRNLFAPQTGTVRVHLGPGQQHYLVGWINVDANLVTAKPDVWADLRNKLPFRDDTVDAFYSHHVIEHLPDDNLPRHFAELFRCLKPGGVIRVGGPNGDVAVRKFLEGDAEWFGDFPRKRRSVGGRFVNFIFCAGEHLTMLSESYLRELLSDAGFSDVVVRSPHDDTGYPELFDRQVLDKEERSRKDVAATLLVEARKHVQCSPAD